jgi:6-phosphogluconolactonase (cycloisomerase 2 family)
MRRTVWTIAFIASLGAAQAAPDASTCNAPGPAILDVSLPGRPFSAVPTPDGCRIFLSLANPGGRDGAVAVLKRANGKLSFESSVMLPATPMGLRLTHDGTIAAVTAGDGVTFLDAQGPLSDKSVLGHIEDGGKAAVYVAFTPDDALLFVADERSQSIAAIDFAKARSSGFANSAVIGSIPVGNAPVGLAVSPDGRTLYATAQAIPEPSWPQDCKSERDDARLHRRGALYAIDVAKAKTDPAHAATRRAEAACNPVRVVLSPRGDRAYVSARGSDALLTFDTAKLLAGDGGALIASVPVGESPVGVAAVKDGSTIVVTDSARFAADRSEHQKLTFVNAARIGTDSAAVTGTVEVGAFPRELYLTPDGGTLLVSNAGSNSLTAINLAAVSVKKAEN